MRRRSAAGAALVLLAVGGLTACTAEDADSSSSAAAVTTAERVARIALADCRRWTTGEVDPELAALVTPELLTRALEELDRSKGYGGMPLPSLLSHLPDDDGNGHDLVAASRGGCEGSGPLRMTDGPLGSR